MRIRAPFYVHDSPLAVQGLTSYRYKGRFGWIMIGAKNHADALKEAARSTNSVQAANLQVWNGAQYVAAKFETNLTEAA